MGTFTNSEDQDEMLHNATFIRVYTVCIGKKKSSDKIIQYIFF